MIRCYSSRTMISCFIFILSSFSGCASELENTDIPPYTQHQVAWDLDEVTEIKGDGLIARFDPNWLMGDNFFTNHNALSAEGLQAFFENTPYGHRSWMADYQMDGVKISQKIIEIAHEVQLNPILLLTRMQVEQGLVSRESMPSTSSLNSALGCGCPDNQSCYQSFKGFDKQLECAGATLRRLFDDSSKAQGIWNAGQNRKTLDNLGIQPANHATAALYAYTPWVLRGEGGNWLVWNITNKFANDLKSRGLLTSAQEDPSCLYRGGRAFVGDPCGCALDCAFWVGNQQGTCHQAGFCTLPCEGGCPDVTGKSPTFCVEDPYALGVGICMAKASEENGHCADLPKTLDVQRPRFIGNSNSLARDALVCAPTP